jgi:hypothetical protein
MAQCTVVSTGAPRRGPMTPSSCLPHMSAPSRILCRLPAQRSPSSLRRERRSGERPVNVPSVVPVEEGCSKWEATDIINVCDVSPPRMQSIIHCTTLSALTRPLLPCRTLALMFVAKQVRTLTAISTPISFETGERSQMSTTTAQLGTTGPYVSRLDAKIA